MNILMYYKFAEITNGSSLHLQYIEMFPYFPTETNDFRARGWKFISLCK